MTNAITKAEINGGAVRVIFDDGRETAYHFLWLRDNCPRGLHPQTRERVFDLLSVGDDVAPIRIAADANALSVWWDGEDAPSVFSAEWLRANAYDGQSLSERRILPTLWGAKDLPAPPRFSFAAVKNGAALPWLLALRDYGLTIIDEAPPRTDAVREAAHLIAPLRRTNFGEEFEVRSKPDPNNVAYTALDLQAHTDLPNREMPPGVQFLHCLANGATGGESVFADGFRIAAEMRETDAAAFALLCDTPLPFRFHDGECDLRFYAPTIALDRHGDFFQIRHHLALTAPLDIDFAKTPAVYRALRAFAALARDSRFALDLRLAPGEIAVFNNRRILHGRRAFDPSSGARHLQGCYVDWDETLSRIRVLERGE
jgi:gamma-butyrobetaine dioxygenase